MITGYNHNVLHLNQVFHIQTEDSGTKYPHIITHLFVGGNIISSKKCSYAHLLEKNLDEVALEKAVRGMMQEQHKDMLRDLKAGLFDHLATGSDSSEELASTHSPQQTAGSPITTATPAQAQPGPPTKARSTPRSDPHVESTESSASQDNLAAERVSPESRTASIRGTARMSRKRPPRERPALEQSSPFNKSTSPGGQPTSVISALRSIEIGSNDNWDLLFEDNTPTVPELPDASLLHPFSPKVTPPLVEQSIHTPVAASEIPAPSGASSLSHAKDPHGGELSLSSTESVGTGPSERVTSATESSTATTDLSDRVQSWFRPHPSEPGGSSQPPQPQPTKHNIVAEGANVRAVITPIRKEPNR